MGLVPPKGSTSEGHISLKFRPPGLWTVEALGVCFHKHMRCVMEMHVHDDLDGGRVHLHGDGG